MTASKVQPRPNSFLSASTAAPQNGALASYGNAAHLQRNTKRCLFGRPDPAETKRLYDESVQQDRQRFITQYRFDTVTGQPVGSSSISSYPSSSSSSSSALRRSPTREYSIGRSNEAANNKRAVPRWFPGCSGTTTAEIFNRWVFPPKNPQIRSGVCVSPTTKTSPEKSGSCALCKKGERHPKKKWHTFGDQFDHEKEREGEGADAHRRSRDDADETKLSVVRSRLLKWPVFQHTFTLQAWRCIGGRSARVKF